VVSLFSKQEGDGGRPLGSVVFEAEDRFAQIFNVERFGHHSLKPIFAEVGHGLVIRIAARYDCLDQRIDFDLFLYRIFTAHAIGYGKVQYHDIKRAA
jgi:hypothetical protein